MAKKYDSAGLMIGGGVLIGLGVGFLINNIVAGLFIGIGCGLVGGALISMHTN
jgi:hypothetical protein